MALSSTSAEATMAFSSTSAEAVFTSRLKDLVQRARTIKQETSIDPPLQVSALLQDNESLVEQIEPRELRELAAEGAAKSILYPILEFARIKDTAFVDVWNLLDIIQGCADRDLCSNQLVLLLAEEVLDSLSIADCHIAFNFLESRREAIMTGPGTSSKEMVILRTCNELLRRLSKAEDPVFCGRVYIFLFQSFPLGHKGSVNLRGEFHVGNVTTFEDYIVSEQSDDVEMEDSADAATEVGPVDSNKEGTQADETKPTETVTRAEKKPSTLDIDTLYPVFWSLQHSFSNPPRLFDGDNFGQFKSALEATLAKFKEVPKVIQSGESFPKKETSLPTNGGNDDFASSFNPKYLTSRDLFKLELSDVAFQRHVLVQALILIDFLLTLTETAQSKSHWKEAQPAMQYKFTLREEDTEWALGIKSSIANYLQDGPDGKFYYRVVDTVLSRDKNWVRWKMDRCKPFTRAKVNPKTYLESKSGAVAAVASKRERKPAGVPPALRFLATAKPGKGLEELRKRGRFVQPSPQEYQARVESTDFGGRTEKDPRSVEEKVTSSGWRGLRLGSRDQQGLLDRFHHAEGLQSLLQPDQTRSEDKGGEGQAEESAEERRADEENIVA